LKKIILLAFVTSAIFFATSCEKEVTTNETVASEIEATHSLTATEQPTTASARAVAVAPSISGITGSKGFDVTNSPTISYGTYYIADYNNSSVITITGSNFGDTQATTSSVVFEKQNTDGTWSVPSSYTVSIDSWKKATIKIKLKSNLNSVPIATARLRVVMATGNSNNVTLSVVPWIYGRQYLQCTHHAIKRTIETLGASYAWTGAYTGATAIDANYVPTAYHVLNWGAPHQAFIESVDVTDESTSVKKYSLTITECNVPTQANGYVYTPVTYNTVIKIKTASNGTTKSFVSGYGTYRSTLTAGATAVRKQP
jgi:hypothetical protein